MPSSSPSLGARLTGAPSPSANVDKTARPAPGGPSIDAPRRPVARGTEALMRVAPDLPDLRVILMRRPTLLTRQTAVYPSNLVAFARRADGHFYCRGQSIALRDEDCFVIRGHEVWGHQVVGVARTIGFIRIPDGLDAILPPRADGTAWGGLLPPGVAMRRVPGLARRMAGPVRRLFEARTKADQVAVVREVAELVRDAVREDDAVVRCPAGPPAPVVEAILAKVEAEVPSRLELKELAADFHTTPAALIGRFRAAMGLTPHQYLTARRVALGLSALASTHSTADAVAEGNFADQAHFIRRFKEAYEQTPGRFVRETALPNALRRTR